MHDTHFEAKFYWKQNILLEAKIFTSKRKNVAFCYFFIATNRIYFTLFRLEELIESCFNSYFSFWIKKRNLKKGNFVGHNTLPGGRLGGPGPAPAPPRSYPGGWAGTPPRCCCPRTPQSCRQ